MDSSPTKSNSGSKVQVFLEDSWSQDELETYSKRKDSVSNYKAVQAFNCLSYCPLDNA